MKKEDLIFALLWPLAILRVLFSPFSGLSKKTIGIGFILFFLWIGVGTSIYLARYGTHRKLYEDRLEERVVLEKRKKELLEEYVYHPTSRDILVELANLSYQLDQPDDTRRYVQELEKVDPNHPLTQELHQYLP